MQGKEKRPNFFFSSGTEYATYNLTYGACLLLEVISRQLWWGLDCVRQTSPAQTRPLPLAVLLRTIDVCDVPPAGLN